MEVNKRYPIANSTIVFREEFDDWAILFDPDTNETLGMNPVSAFLWKKLDGQHNQEDILKLVKENYDDVPDDASEHINIFLADIERRGWIGFAQT